MARSSVLVNRSKSARGAVGLAALALLVLGVTARPADAATLRSLSPPSWWAMKILFGPERVGGSACLGVNSLGDVVGRSGRRDGTEIRQAPTIWPGGGQPAYLPMPPGFLHGEANDIADDGSIIGHVWNDPNGPRTGVVWRRTDAAGSLAATLIRNEATDRSIRLTGINDRNGIVEVIANKELADNGTAASLLQIDGTGTKTLPLPSLGGPNAFAASINQSGVIGGRSDNAQGQRVPTVWSLNPDNQSFVAKPLPLPDGSKGGEVTAINNVDTAVGSIEIADGAAHVAVWTGLSGTPSLRDHGTLPGFRNGVAFTLNDAGFGVGEAFSSPGRLALYFIRKSDGKLVFADPASITDFGGSFPDANARGTDGNEWQVTFSASFEFDPDNPFGGVMEPGFRPDIRSQDAVTTEDRAELERIIRDLDDLIDDEGDTSGRRLQRELDRLQKVKDRLRGATCLLFFIHGAADRLDRVAEREGGALEDDIVDIVEDLDALTTKIANRLGITFAN